MKDPVKWHSNFTTNVCRYYFCSDGIVHALDVSEEFTSIGKPFWKEAGVDHKIKLTIAPAAESLTKLVEAGEENTFDFAFIDADKVSKEMSFILFITLHLVLRLDMTRTMNCV